MGHAKINRSNVAWKELLMRASDWHGHRMSEGYCGSYAYQRARLGLRKRQVACKMNQRWSSLSVNGITDDDKRSRPGDDERTNAVQDIMMLFRDDESVIESQDGQLDETIIANQRTMTVSQNYDQLTQAQWYRIAHSRSQTGHFPSKGGE